MGRRPISEDLRRVIPRLEFEVNIDVVYDNLRVPTEEQVSDGFTVNSEYEPMYPMGWPFADEIAGLEFEFLNELVDLAGPADFDRAADELEHEADGSEELEGLELGVAGVVASLVEAGCVTTFSCRGHQNRGTPTCPQVRFAADIERARILAEIAQLTGCGFQSDDERLLWVIAPSLVEMMEFADEVRMQSDRFDALQPPVRRGW